MPSRLRCTFAVGRRRTFIRSEPDAILEPAGGVVQAHVS
jgi:hypothetical protein